MIVWLAEAPTHSGLYANATEWHRGKVSTGLEVSMDVHAARQFATEAECQAWCDANPAPAFVPREHVL